MIILKDTKNDFLSKKIQTRYPGMLKDKVYIKEDFDKLPKSFLKYFK